MASASNGAKSIPASAAASVSLPGALRVLVDANMCALITQYVALPELVRLGRSHRLLIPTINAWDAPVWRRHFHTLRHRAECTLYNQWRATSEPHVFDPSYGGEQDGRTVYDEDVDLGELWHYAGDESDESSALDPNRYPHVACRWVTPALAATKQLTRLPLRGGSGGGTDATLKLAGAVASAAVAVAAASRSVTDAATSNSAAAELIPVVDYKERLRLLLTGTGNNETLRRQHATISIERTWLQHRNGVPREFSVGEPCDLANCMDPEAFQSDLNSIVNAFKRVHSIRTRLTSSPEPQTCVQPNVVFDAPLQRAVLSQLATVIDSIKTCLPSEWPPVHTPGTAGVVPPKWSITSLRPDSDNREAADDKRIRLGWTNHGTFYTAGVDLAVAESDGKAKAVIHPVTSTGYEHTSSSHGDKFLAIAQIAVKAAQQLCTEFGRTISDAKFIKPQTAAATGAAASADSKHVASWIDAVTRIKSQLRAAVRSFPTHRLHRALAFVMLIEYELRLCVLPPREQREAEAKARQDAALRTTKPAVAAFEASEASETDTTKFKAAAKRIPAVAASGVTVPDAHARNFAIDDINTDERNGGERVVPMYPVVLTKAIDEDSAEDSSSEIDMLESELPADGKGEDDSEGEGEGEAAGDAKVSPTATVIVPGTSPILTVANTNSNPASAVAATDAKIGSSSAAPKGNKRKRLLPPRPPNRVRVAGSVESMARLPATEDPASVSWNPQYPRMLLSLIAGAEMEKSVWEKHHTALNYSILENWLSHPAKRIVAMLQCAYWYTTTNVETDFTIEFAHDKVLPHVKALQHVANAPLAIASSSASAMSDTKLPPPPSVVSLTLTPSQQNSYYFLLHNYIHLLMRAGGVARATPDVCDVAHEFMMDWIGSVLVACVSHELVNRYAKAGRNDRGKWTLNAIGPASDDESEFDYQSCGSSDSEYEHRPSVARKRVKHSAAGTSAAGDATADSFAAAFGAAFAMAVPSSPTKALSSSVSPKKPSAVAAAAVAPLTAFSADKWLVLHSLAVGYRPLSYTDPVKSFQQKVRSGTAGIPEPLCRPSQVVYTGDGLDVVTSIPDEPTGAKKVGIDGRGDSDAAAALDDSEYLPPERKDLNSRPLPPVATAAAPTPTAAGIINIETKSASSTAAATAPSKDGSDSDGDEWASSDSDSASASASSPEVRYEDRGREEYEQVSDGDVFITDPDKDLVAISENRPVPFEEDVDRNVTIDDREHLFGATRDSLIQHAVTRLKVEAKRKKQREASASGGTASATATAATAASGGSDPQTPDRKSSVTATKKTAIDPAALTPNQRRIFDYLTAASDAKAATVPFSAALDLNSIRAWKWRERVGGRRAAIDAGDVDETAGGAGGSTALEALNRTGVSSSAVAPVRITTLAEYEWARGIFNEELVNRLLLTDAFSAPQQSEDDFTGVSFRYRWAEDTYSDLADDPTCMLFDTLYTFGIDHNLTPQNVKSMPGHLIWQIASDAAEFRVKGFATSGAADTLEGMIVRATSKRKRFQELVTARRRRAIIKHHALEKKKGEKPKTSRWGMRLDFEGMPHWSDDETIPSDGDGSDAKSERGESADEDVPSPKSKKDRKEDPTSSLAGAVAASATRDISSSEDVESGSDATTNSDDDDGTTDAHEARCWTRVWRRTHRFKSAKGIEHQFDDAWIRRKRIKTDAAIRDSSMRDVKLETERWIWSERLRERIVVPLPTTSTTATVTAATAATASLVKVPSPLADDSPVPTDWRNCMYYDKQLQTLVYRKPEYDEKSPASASAAVAALTAIAGTDPSAADELVDVDEVNTLTCDVGGITTPYEPKLPAPAKTASAGDEKKVATTAGAAAEMDGDDDADGADDEDDADEENADADNSGSLPSPPPISISTRYRPQQLLALSEIQFIQSQTHLTAQPDCFCQLIHSVLSSSKFKRMLAAAITKLAKAAKLPPQPNLPSIAVPADAARVLNVALTSVMHSLFESSLIASVDRGRRDWKSDAAGVPVLTSRDIELAVTQYANGARLIGRNAMSRSSDRSY